MTFRGLPQNSLHVKISLRLPKRHSISPSSNAICFRRIKVEIFLSFLIPYPIYIAKRSLEGCLSSYEMPISSNLYCTMFAMSRLESRFKLRVKSDEDSKIKSPSCRPSYLLRRANHNLLQPILRIFIYHPNLNLSLLQ